MFSISKHFFRIKSYEDLKLRCKEKYPELKGTGFTYLGLDGVNGIEPKCLIEKDGKEIVVYKNDLDLYCIERNLPLFKDGDKLPEVAYIVAASDGNRLIFKNSEDERLWDFIVNANIKISMPKKISPKLHCGYHIDAGVRTNQLIPLGWNILEKFVKASDELIYLGKFEGVLNFSILELAGLRDYNKLFDPQKENCRRAFFPQSRKVIENFSKVKHPCLAYQKQPTMNLKYDSGSGTLHDVFIRTSDGQIFFSMMRGAYEILEKTKQYSLKQEYIDSVISQANDKVVSGLREYVEFVSNNFKDFKEIPEEYKSKCNYYHEVFNKGWKYVFPCSEGYSVFNNYPKELFQLVLKWDDDEVERLISNVNNTFKWVDESRW